MSRGVVGSCSAMRVSSDTDRRFFSFGKRFRRTALLKGKAPGQCIHAKCMQEARRIMSLRAFKKCRIFAKACRIPATIPL